MSKESSFKGKGMDKSYLELRKLSTVFLQSSVPTNPKICPIPFSVLCLKVFPQQKVLCSQCLKSVRLANILAGPFSNYLGKYYFPTLISQFKRPPQIWEKYRILWLIFCLTPKFYLVFLHHDSSFKIVQRM